MFLSIIFLCRERRSPRLYSRNQTVWKCQNFFQWQWLFQKSKYYIWALILSTWNISKKNWFHFRVDFFVAETAIQWLVLTNGPLYWEPAICGRWRSKSRQLYQYFWWLFFIDFNNFLSFIIFYSSLHSIVIHIYTVYRELLAFVLFSPLLSVYESKNGQIPMSQIISP